MIAQPFIYTRQDDSWVYPQDDLWAYSDLPTILLAPATFRTQGECDEYFDALRWRVVQAAQAEIERIDAQRRASCKASDKSCAAPLCKRRRDAVVERTRGQLNRVDVLRGHITVEIP